MPAWTQQKMHLFSLFVKTAQKSLDVDCLVRLSHLNSPPYELAISALNETVVLPGNAERFITGHLDTMNLERSFAASSFFDDGARRWRSPSYLIKHLILFNGSVTAALLDSMRRELPVEDTVKRGDWPGFGSQTVCITNHYIAPELYDKIYKVWRIILPRERFCIQARRCAGGFPFPASYLATFRKDTSPVTSTPAPAVRILGVGLNDLCNIDTTQVIDVELVGDNELFCGRNHIVTGELELSIGLFMTRHFLHHGEDFDKIDHSSAHKQQAIRLRKLKKFTLSNMATFQQDEPRGLFWVPRDRQHNNSKDPCTATPSN